MSVHCVCGPRLGGPVWFVCESCKRGRLERERSERERRARALELASAVRVVADGGYGPWDVFGVAAPDSLAGRVAALVHRRRYSSPLYNRRMSAAACLGAGRCVFDSAYRRLLELG